MLDNLQDIKYLVEEYYFVSGITAIDTNDDAITTNGAQNLQEYLNKKQKEGWYLISILKQSNNRGSMATAFDLLLTFGKAT